MTFSKYYSQKLTFGLAAANSPKELIRSVCVYLKLFDSVYHLSCSYDSRHLYTRCVHNFFLRRDMPPDSAYHLSFNSYCSL